MVQQKSHFGIYAVILKDKHILLVEKSRGPYIGLLDLPGGSPLFGESVYDTLSRETKEETGISLTQVSLFDNYSAHFFVDNSDAPYWLHHLGMIYLIDSYDNEPRKELESSDTAHCDWFDLRALSKNKLSPFADSVVTALKKNPLLW